jgi:hypothetical protein
MPRTYDPGTPTVARHIRDGIYAIDSFKGENTTYLIDLNRLTCTCGHYQERLAGTNGLCKHQKQLLLQETTVDILEKARQYATADLDKALERYRALDRPEVCNAILLVRQERLQTTAKKMSETELKELFR